MAQNQFSSDSYSDLRDVYQFLFWDRVMKRIEAFHEIRVNAYIDPYLETRETYIYNPNNHKEYDAIVEEFKDEIEIKLKIDTEKTKVVITVFTYKETEVDRNYSYTKRFPAEGGFYPLNLYKVPHVVIAIKEPTGANSTAAGEAL
ncbi:MAG: hypothetical protein K8R74_04525 [Bacteroidales bacterium]|nr:hypothetical protein [Bacteroidales bacterium]